MDEFHGFVCASQTERVSPALLILSVPAEEALIKTLIKLPKPLFVIRSHLRSHTSGASQVRVCLSGCNGDSWLEWELHIAVNVLWIFFCLNFKYQKRRACNFRRCTGQSCMLSSLGKNTQLSLGLQEMFPLQSPNKGNADSVWSDVGCTWIQNTTRPEDQAIRRHRQACMFCAFWHAFMFACI